MTTRAWLVVTAALTLFLMWVAYRAGWKFALGLGVFEAACLVALSHLVAQGE